MREKKFYECIGEIRRKLSIVEANSDILRIDIEKTKRLLDRYKEKKENGDVGFDPIVEFIVEDLEDIIRILEKMEIV